MNLNYVKSHLILHFIYYQLLKYRLHEENLAATTEKLSTFEALLQALQADCQNFPGAKEVSQYAYSLLLELPIFLPHQRDLLYKYIEKFENYFPEKIMALPVDGFCEALYFPILLAQESDELGIKNLLEVRPSPQNEERSIVMGNRLPERVHVFSELIETLDGSQKRVEVDLREPEVKINTRWQGFTFIQKIAREKKLSYQSALQNIEANLNNFLHNRNHDESYLPKEESVKLNINEDTLVLRLPRYKGDQEPADPQLGQLVRPNKPVQFFTKKNSVTQLTLKGVTFNPLKAAFSVLVKMTWPETKIKFSASKNQVSFERPWVGQIQEVKDYRQKNLGITLFNNTAIEQNKFKEKIQQEGHEVQNEVLACFSANSFLGLTFLYRSYTTLQTFPFVMHAIEMLTFFKRKGIQLPIFYMGRTQAGINTFHSLQQDKLLSYLLYASPQAQNRVFDQLSHNPNVVPILQRLWINYFKFPWLHLNDNGLSFLEKLIANMGSKGAYLNNRTYFSAIAAIMLLLRKNVEVLSSTSQAIFQFLKTIISAYPTLVENAGWQSFMDAVIETYNELYGQSMGRETTAAASETKAIAYLLKTISPLPQDPLWEIKNVNGPLSSFYRKSTLKLFAAMSHENDQSLYKVRVTLREMDEDTLKEEAKKLSLQNEGFVLQISFSAPANSLDCKVSLIYLNVFDEEKQPIFSVRTYQLSRAKLHLFFQHVNLLKDISLEDPRIALRLPERMAISSDPDFLAFFLFPKAPPFRVENSFDTLFILSEFPFRGRFFNIHTFCLFVKLQQYNLISQITPETISDYVKDNFANAMNDPEALLSFALDCRDILQNAQILLAFNDIQNKVQEYIEYFLKCLATHLFLKLSEGTAKEKMVLYVWRQTAERLINHPLLTHFLNLLQGLVFQYPNYHLASLTIEKIFIDFDFTRSMHCPLELTGAPVLIGEIPNVIMPLENSSDDDDDDDEALQDRRKRLRLG